MNYPKQIFSWISDREARPASGEKFPKLNPATGEVLGWVAAGGGKEAAKAGAGKNPSPPPPPFFPARVEFWQSSSPPPLAAGN